MYLCIVFVHDIAWILTHHVETNGALLNTKPSLQIKVGHKNSKMHCVLNVQLIKFKF